MSTKEKDRSRSGTPLESHEPCAHLPAQRRTQAVVECQDAVGSHHLQGHSSHAQLHLLLGLQVHLCEGRVGG